MLTQRVLVPLGAIVLVALAAVVAQERAGDRPPEDRPQRQDQGPRDRNFDPSQFRQRMIENLKEQLKATEEEWSVLQPKLEKLADAQRAARTGMGGRGGFGGPGGFRGGEEREPTNDMERASRDLRTALQDETTAASDIASKLTAFREAREKAQAELSAARADIKELLTQRQEAVLVMMGMLE